MNKTLKNSVIGFSIAVTVAGVLLLGVASAEGAASSAAANLSSTDPHAHHKAMMKKTTYARSTHTYDLAGLDVTSSDAVETTLTELLSDDQLVLVHFIFTTCTTICPVQAATFSQVQRHLGEEASRVQMVSVSIDPEYDTPARLQEYAKNFRAGPQWQFLTGSVAEMIDIQKAFDAYNGAKMNHQALTLIKAPNSPEWIRLEGLPSAADIVDELELLTSTS